MAAGKELPGTAEFSVLKGLHASSARMSDAEMLFFFFLGQCDSLVQWFLVAAALQVDCNTPSFTMW